MKCSRCSEWSACTIHPISVSANDIFVICSPFVPAWQASVVALSLRAPLGSQAFGAPVGFWCFLIFHRVFPVFLVFLISGSFRAPSGSRDKGWPRGGPFGNLSRPNPSSLCCQNTREGTRLPPRVAQAEQQLSPNAATLHTLHDGEPSTEQQV